VSNMRENQKNKPLLFCLVIIVSNQIIISKQTKTKRSKVNYKLMQRNTILEKNRIRMMTILPSCKTSIDFPLELLLSVPIQ